MSRTHSEEGVALTILAIGAVVVFAFDVPFITIMTKVI